MVRDYQSLLNEARLKLYGETNAMYFSLGEVVLLDTEFRADRAKGEEDSGPRKREEVGAGLDKALSKCLLGGKGKATLGRVLELKGPERNFGRSVLYHDVVVREHLDYTSDRGLDNVLLDIEMRRKSE